MGIYQRAAGGLVFAIEACRQLLADLVTFDAHSHDTYCRREMRAGSRRMRTVMLPGMSPYSGNDEHITALALAARSGDRAATAAFVAATQRDVIKFVAHLAGQPTPKTWRKTHSSGP